VGRPIGFQARVDVMVPDHGGCAIDRRSKCKVRSGGCDDFEQ